MDLTTINLEITRHCNLKCPMCPVRTYPVEQKHMELEQVKDIIERIPTLKSLQIIGWGEPLLYPWWNELVVYLNEKEIALTFTTNGTLFTEENIAPLHPTTYIAVSIDSVDPDVYMKIRGAPVDKTIENVKLLRRMKPLVTMFFNTLVMKETIDTLPLLLPLAKQVDAEITLTYPLTYNPKDYKRFYPKLKDLRQKIKALHRLAYNKYRLRLKQGLTEPKMMPCLQPFTSLSIGLNGEAYACCYTHSAKKSDGLIPQFREYYNNTYLRVPIEQYHLGNVFTDNIDEMFNGDKIDNIRKAIMDTPKITDYNNTRAQCNILEPNKYCEICADRWGVIN